MQFPKLPFYNCLIQETIMLKELIIKDQLHMIKKKMKKIMNNNKNKNKVQEILNW